MFNGQIFRCIARIRHLLAPLVVFAAGFAGSLLGWHLSAVAVEDAVRARFDEVVENTMQAIEARMRGYEPVLRGGAALFAIAGKVSRAEWHAYVVSLRLNDSYPGFRSLDYTVRVAGRDKIAHVRRVRSEGLPGYEIRPAGERPVYFPVLYQEIVDGRKPGTSGFDMYSEPVRRAAADRARDTGEVMASGKIILVGDGNPQPGFLLIYPVYGKGLPTGTLEERRRALLGLVVAPFRMPDLVRDIFGDPRGDIGLKIFDQEIGENSLLFDYDQEHALRAGNPSPSGDFVTTRSLEIAGATWKLHFEGRPQLAVPAARVLPATVLVLGLLLSLGAAALTWWLAVARSSAVRAAARDPLTGLYNRRYMEDTLQREEARARRSGRPIGIIMLDLDNFKKLNDTWGHDTGDAALRAFAGHLRKLAREGDIVCRYGGEEFIVILPGASLAAAAARAETMRQGLDELMLQHEGEDIGTITVSAGVAAFPEHGDPVSATVQAADQALLRAKRAGRDRVALA